MHKVWISKVGRSFDREVEEALEWLDWRSVVAPDAHVSIKPNLTYPKPREGVTTSLVALEAVIRAIRSRTRNINVVESDAGSDAWTADDAFEGHGIDTMCCRYGARTINLTRCPREKVATEIAGRRVKVQLPRVLTRETEVFITMPVPKLHMMTGVSLGFKNQWGCLPDVKRLREHSDFARKILAINKIVNPQLAIFDGTWFLDRSGPLEGEPVRKDLLIASRDAGAGSMVCCELMGIEPKSIAHLRLAIAERMMPRHMSAVVLNAAPDQFKGVPFKLHRTWFQWVTLAVFHSRAATIALYDSPLASPAHKLLYFFRGDTEFSPKW
ncbi:MAG TPA: DUF362 domain-containing protein [Candidatus Binataceae bacterium]|nr:DUF362 domain-containing protein [Candidatus Binataceae bacterium]